jgi:hypothetical protein
MEYGATFREYKFAGNDERTFEGYGAMFGNVDSYGDAIMPGAFAKTLAAHAAAGTKPPMFLDHGFSAAGMVIGVWEALSEDGQGLVAKGRLLDTAAGEDTYKAMKAGAINGLSIGYRAIDFELRSKPDDPRRTLKAVDLLEVSVVALPANPKARVQAVKSMLPEIKTVRDFEEFLRDFAGFSDAQAKAVASSGFKAFDASRDGGESVDELAERIRRNINLLKGH